MTEIKQIKRDGATPQKNSGRGWIQKGDATLDGVFLLDYKEYTESFAVSRKNWAKLQSDAFRSGQKVPAFRIILGDTSNEADKLRLWVVDDNMFFEMYDAWKEKYGDQG